MNVEINEFREWMDARRLRAADVCEALHVSEQAIHNWRSAGVPPRRIPHVKKYMAEWVDPASTPVGQAVTNEAVRLLAESRQNLILRPSSAEFDAWSAAFKASDCETFQQWAMDGLNSLAEARESTSSNLASLPTAPAKDAAMGE